MSDTRPLKIAVIGSGAAGITAACLLQGNHQVTLYERDSALGGHAHSETIDNGIEPPFEVDTAFVVFNSASYPLFLQLLSRFGLRERVRKTEMSFSYSDASRGLNYALNRGLGGVFAERRNLLNPALYRLLPELMRFRKQAAQDLHERPDLHRVSLSDYLALRRHSRAFAENFLYPTAMAVWSVSASRIRDFPAVSFLRFLDNHRYLGGQRGQWLTIEGGCRQYVRAFQKSFKGTVLTGHDVASIARDASGVEVRTTSGTPIRYDKVILAVHADQALRLLTSPSERERELLGAWTYQKTPTVLHEDASAMPSNPRLWSSWNIRHDSSGTTAEQNQITYHLNRVQGLSSRKNYFVTLGGANLPDKNVLARFDYEHPIYDFRAVASQRELPSLNRGTSVLFCGSYFGFGFHEDAIRSATEVAALLL